MRNHTVVLFGNKNALEVNGFAINRRLLDLLSDPAHRFGNPPDSLQEVFEKDYQDVYAFLQRTMFSQTGEVVWTFAPQLERAGFAVFKLDIGIGIHLGDRVIEIASFPEARSRDPITGRTVYLLPTQLRALERQAKENPRERLERVEKEMSALSETHTALMAEMANYQHLDNRIAQREM